MPVSIEDAFASAKDSNAYRRTLVVIDVIRPGEGVVMPTSDNDRDNLLYKLEVMEKYLSDPLVAETYATLKSNIDKYDQLH